MIDLTTVVLRRVLVIVLAIIVCTIAAAAIIRTSSVLSMWWLARTPTAQVFEYESVDFSKRVGTQADGSPLIEMVSVLAYYREIDVAVWRDELRCGPDGRIVSTSTTEGAELGPRPLGPVFWEYAGRVPVDDRECFMRSTISVEVDGVTFRTGPFFSSPFRPGAVPIEEPSEPADG